MSPERHGAVAYGGPSPHSLAHEQITAVHINGPRGTVHTRAKSSTAISVSKHQYDWVHEQGEWRLLEFWVVWTEKDKDPLIGGAASV